jgi:hypothetical protein
MPSLVAEIGFSLLKHFDYIDLLNGLPNNGAGDTIIEKPTVDIDNEASYPDNATVCKKCHAKAVIRLDNCATCLNCQDSACG